jgi:hypothetical protein
VCWQRKPPASVQIKLTVGKTGDVTSATAKTKGVHAQCAAGILAVQSLGTGAWKGVIAIESTSEDKANDVRAINDALSGHRDEFYKCQKKASEFVGKVTLRVTVSSTGAITAASAEADAAAGKPVAACVAAVAKKLTLVAISSESITYDLGIQYAGEDKGDASAGGDGDADLQPSKKGPLESDDLMPVISGKRAQIEKCAKGSKARGKVVVRVAIGADGKITKTKIKSSELDDSKVEECLLKVFNTMKFRESTGETVVLYPIKLTDDGVKTGG